MTIFVITTQALDLGPIGSAFGTGNGFRIKLCLSGMTIQPHPLPSPPLEEAGVKTEISLTFLQAAGDLPLIIRSDKFKHQQSFQFK